MQPLEQVTVLMTIMRQLIQIMDHETAVISTMKLEGLGDLQAEKAALAEAYEIELRHLRKTPESLGSLDPAIREELEFATREFQEAVGRNTRALTTAKTVVEKLVNAIGESIAMQGGYAEAYSAEGQSERRSAEIISLSFDTRC
ncbi:MAG: hypothetical protein ACFB6S_00430 [Geminicoccaceae bacterium]